jgi:uncharacterized protein YaaN involved in tellurite resistance
MTTESTPTAAATVPTLALDLNVSQAKAELALPEPDVDAELRAKARELASRLIAIDPADESSKEASRQAVESMGRDLQKGAATKSRMLQTPIRELSQNAEDGGPVANALVDLRVEVEKLDPASVDLSPGWVTRTVGLIPGIGTPLKRYFMRYESSQTVIDAILKSLEKGRDQLKRDNVTLGEDQKAMRQLTLSLTEQVSLAMSLDEEISRALTSEIAMDDPRRRFIEEELLFNLRQRTMDLQQQLAVNQQGVLATELIIRNNRELIRGVDRAIDVTVSALQVAVTVALALAHQKIVLDKVEAINRTTSDLIAGTAERLRTQGTEIHRQASSTMLDMESLRSAFANITGALDEISRYRREALPQMASNILELDRMTAAGEEAIDRMEKAQAASDEAEAAIEPNQGG